MNTTPRKIHPTIVLLRAEHSAKVANLRRSFQSAQILKNILNVKLERMTDEDKNKLADSLLEAGITATLIPKP